MVPLPAPRGTAWSHLSPPPAQHKRGTGDAVCKDFLKIPAEQFSIRSFVPFSLYDPGRAGATPTNVGAARGLGEER